MSNHLELAQRQIDDRQELLKVRQEMAIQRKGLANLEDREAAIIARMDDRQDAITALLQADKSAGLVQIAQYAPDESAAAEIDVLIAAQEMEARPNGATF